MKKVAIEKLVVFVEDLELIDFFCGQAKILKCVLIHRDSKGLQCVQAQKVLLIHLDTLQAPYLVKLPQYE